jgi:hypothetical protein
VRWGCVLRVQLGSEGSWGRTGWARSWGTGACVDWYAVRPPCNLPGLGDNPLLDLHVTLAAGAAAGAAGALRAAVALGAEGSGNPAQWRLQRVQAREGRDTFTREDLLKVMGGGDTDGLPELNSTVPWDTASSGAVWPAARECSLAALLTALPQLQRLRLVGTPAGVVLEGCG